MIQKLNPLHIGPYCLMIGQQDQLVRHVTGNGIDHEFDPPIKIDDALSLDQWASTARNLASELHHLRSRHEIMVYRIGRVLNGDE